MMWTTIFPIILLSGSVYSNPAARHRRVSCGLSEARLQVPPNQSQLVAPDSPPSYIALAAGTQNYTCHATTYTLTGAVAELFDGSCLYKTPVFDTAPALAYAAWKAVPDVITPEAVIIALNLVPNPLILGSHTYVPNPTGSGLSPKWDLTGIMGNPNAYVIGEKVGDLPSANPTVNIDDLMIKSIGGDLASLVFRVQDNGGQPPAECSTPGSTITVKYTAYYWFFGGSGDNM